MKTCSRCKESKELSDFNKTKTNKDGFDNICRECKSYRNKEYRLRNLENEKVRVKEYKYDRSEYMKNYRRTYEKNRRMNDPLFRLSKNIRSMISIRIKRVKKTNSTIQILGCSIAELKVHLENKFESWMTWDNYGLYNGEPNYGWDIDHIIPVTSAQTNDILYKLNHYTNLQPLCSYYNRYIKSDTVL